jgi:hypothetical protein
LQILPATIAIRRFPKTLNPFGGGTDYIQHIGFMFSIAIGANNFRFASGKAAARAMKVPLYGTPAGSILRRILEDEA